MPSTRSRSGGLSLSAARLETPLLLVAAAAFGWLLSEGTVFGRSLSTALFLGVLMPLITVAAAAAARRMGSHCLHMSVFMIIGGGIGLLAGVDLDFGPLGLIGLAAWCSTLPAFSVDAAVTRVTVATWSYAGMFIGCNLGMLASNLVFRQDPVSRRRLPIRYLSCNGWMLVGMLLAESLWPDAAFMAGAAVAAVGMVIVMFAGMSAGMWIGWWSVDWMVKGRTADLPPGKTKEKNGRRPMGETITKATMGSRVN